MRKLFFAIVLALTGRLFSQTNSYFLSNPTLTPDGQTVIFSFEGDLWKANVNDGQATRLTAMQGYETSPRVSPDGKWIAFTGRQYGFGDVYIMPVNGGEIKQLTWYSSPVVFSDEVMSWSWDSQYIYFNSGRTGRIRGFKVNVNGGTPQLIFGEYFFQYDHDLVEHPTSGEIFFDDTWESHSQLQRKRYKGPFNPEIQSYNLVTKQYRKYTDWKGKDFATTIDRNGNIYFISDEVNGEYNLYTLDNGKKKALTKYSSSIKAPQVNANGGKIVFEKDYQLLLYDVKSGKESKLNISIIRNNILIKEKDFEVSGNISAFDVSPDGKKLAFVSRGELFVSDAEGKFVRQINRGSAERVREAKWMTDNKTLLFNQTLDGYYNWFTIKADSSGFPKQHTSDKRNNRSIVFNKKRTQAVYMSGYDEVRLLDLKNMQSKTIVKGILWDLLDNEPGFSPNDEYIFFAANPNLESDIFLYHIKENKTINLTKTDVTESDPAWSDDGKYIYFTSNRTQPFESIGWQNARVYRLALEKLDEPFRLDKVIELFKEEKKDTTIKTVRADSLKAITIDMDLIMERLEQISPSVGSQSMQYVYQKGEKAIVFYTSNHGDARDALWKTVIEPFEQNKTEKIAGTDNPGSLKIVEVNDKVCLLFNGNINKLNLDGNKVDPINISYVFRRNLSEEFNQMFYEVWALMEENYYDDKFHGLDWMKTKDYYKQFLPYLNNRNDLRILIKDMLGELNSSHLGFGTFGDDENIALQNQTMETGIIFENEKPYKVKYVLRRSATDKKTIDIKPGDILIKVNNRDVDENSDRYSYFTIPTPLKELQLSFNRTGQVINVKVHPQVALTNNLYDEWIDNNQKRVDEKGRGRIAYGCMKNMGSVELDKFIIDMTKELNKKDALILDLRYNTGGTVHDEVLKFLLQRSYFKWKTRRGNFTPQSHFSPADKPIVLLINEQSLSDAEITSQGFKELKLGKILGNETYRWVITTGPLWLVDGSFINMPGSGCYSLDGKDLEMTGVQPDIFVINSFDDKLNGRDPQLDRAIEEILKQLK